ncbi:MAG: hypothetical protein GDA50_07045 [Alphaproteobacteria bacterium GM202ARS2]|nr:hypothetical protein [Alphaproteobacteria bacterium GM202ARS2]
MSQCSQDIRRFYDLLAVLSQRLGGARRLCACEGRMDWPQRGVYFFYEADEERQQSGSGLRLVRVGTHALTSGSKTSLWNRLSQHRGQARSGGGNHRGSIFRLLVGTALIKRYDLSGHHGASTWGRGSSAPRDIRQDEQEIEQRVSAVIGAMPFLWLAVEDDANPESQRGTIERNAIALLSNHSKQAIDPPSADWLGLDCNRPLVRQSGLWNQNHVDESYDPSFLDTFARLIDAMGATS